MAAKVPRGADVIEGLDASGFHPCPVATVFDQHLLVTRLSGGDIVCGDALGHAAEDDLHLIVHQSLVDHYLERGAGRQTIVGHLDQFDLLVLELAGEHLAGVGEGIDLANAAPDEVPAFVDFGRGRAAAPGKASGACHLHRTHSEDTESAVYVARTDDDGGDGVRSCRQTTVVQFLLRQGRFEEREVDFFDELFDFEGLFADFLGAGFTGSAFGGGGL